MTVSGSVTVAAGYVTGWGSGPGSARRVFISGVSDPPCAYL